MSDYAAATAAVGEPTAAGAAPASTTAAPLNSILVVGGSKVGKRFIVQSLVASRQAAANAGGASTNASAVAAHSRLPHSRIENYRCAVDTKYYSADLTFHVLPAEQHAAFGAVESEQSEEQKTKEASDAAPAATAAASAAASAASPAPVLSDSAHAEFRALEFQAAMLVFDLSSAASFHALASSWLPFLQDRAPSVLLCVGNDAQAPNAAQPRTAAQRQERDDLEQLAKDWALDNGLEYVSMPHNDKLSQKPSTTLGTPSLAAVAASSTARGAGRRGGVGLEADDDDDADSSDIELDPSAEPAGLSRLLEALECNMWTHLTLKDKRSMKYLPGAKESRPSEDADVDGDNEESAFRDMQERHAEHANTHAEEEEEHKSEDGEEKFEQFVSAFPFVAESNAAQAAAAAANASEAAPPAQAAAAASSTSAASSAKPAPASKSKSSADAASRNAFANAFARAIRTDDPPASSAKVAKKPLTAAPATAAASVAALNEPLTPTEMDTMASQLLAAQQAAEASHRSADGAAAAADDSAADSKLESDMVAFDAVFDKISSIKAEAVRARAAGADGSLSDADRRKRAEDTVMQLLKSMGMEDELDGLDDEDEPEDAEAKAQ